VIYHIEHHGSTYVVRDEKNGYYGTFKTRAAAQEQIYKMSKAEEGK
jgi:hypothetical protein